MNPESGGRPPRDIRIRGVKAISVGILVEEMARVLILVELLSLNTRKIEKVIMM